MPKINVLPKSLAELIAAGEVVERPASVIKELVENSIDAGATSITAEIKNGGISYIRITDNGCGIAREDVRNAFKSHATSKISTAVDLDAIMTLGFRGEALASVAAVSKVEIMTRTADEEIGTRYCIEAGEEILLDDAGCPVGTTIVVRDLFFCTPARMKFLKKDVTEANAVAGVIDRLALSHPEISFRFIREGKQTLMTNGSGELLQCVREIFGKDFSSGLIPAAADTDAVKVSGYISKPHCARPNRNMQFFFINGRLIKTATGSAALSEGYKNSVMVGKFPSCVLNIELLPSAVDVNVHPAKTEVRFSNEKAVFNAIYFACKNALAQDNSRAQYKAKAPVKDFYAQLQKPAEQTTFEKKADFWQHIDMREQKSEPVAVTFVNPGPEVKKETNEPAIVQSVEKKPVSYGASTVTVRNTAPVGYTAKEDDLPDLIPDVLPVTAPASVQAEKPVVKDEPEAKTVQPKTTDALPVEDFTLVGEAFKTYIIVECGGKLMIIDKHAAHERIIYEQLKKDNSERTAQLLLAPVTVTLTKEEYSAIRSNRDLLGKAGFEVEDFGQGMVIVSECPMELDADDVKDVISELAGRFADKKQEVDFEKLDHIYHSVACRSAIKAGDFTSRYEMEQFAKRLLAMPEIRYCPHGRPVLIEMTQRELEKNFGRV
ncbi:MAG: DNA mismatch repair endonuclease MutL [Clostridia bacterium]|nr:DNA mismatch repair endonuclease MutL [Clostridia bacterium]